MIKAIYDELVLAIKYHFHLTKINSYVFEKSAETIREYPEIYKSTADTLSHIKYDVQKKYEETMKDLDNVIIFEEWWKSFCETYEVDKDN